MLASWLFLELSMLLPAPRPLHLTLPGPVILISFSSFKSQLKFQLC